MTHGCIPAAQTFESLAPVRCDLDLVPFELQKTAEHVPRINVVFNDEYCTGRHV